MKRTNAMIGAAWVLYAASWFIQAVKEGAKLGEAILPGWQALLFGFGTFMPGALTNLVMIASPVILWSGFKRLKRALPWLLILATIVNSWWLVNGEPGALLAGYYLWWSSFSLLALACLRERRMSQAAKLRRAFQIIGAWQGSIGSTPLTRDKPLEHLQRL